MNLYLLYDPAKPSEFAQFACFGTWAEDPICSVCGEAKARLVEPLKIEWIEGNDRIGDFSWGEYQCIVVDSVRSFLKANAFEVTFGRVEVMPPAKRRTVHPRVPFPYRGPNLSWLIPTVRLKLDEERSGVRLLSDCSACGKRRYTFKRNGIVVPKNAWSGERLFLIEQFGESRATFITEEGLAILSGAGFSNLRSQLAGKVED